MPNSNADDLADRFLEIWQEHIARLSADPQMAEAMSRLFSAMALPPGFGVGGFAPGAMGPAGFGAAGMAPGGENAADAATAQTYWTAWMRDWMTGGTGDGRDGFGRPRSGSDDGDRDPAGRDEDRSTSADPASLDVRELLVRIDGRLAALEERVAALEKVRSRDASTGNDKVGRGTRRRFGG